MSDAACTKCHADLTRHRADVRNSDLSPQVTSFPADHPDFRSLKNDAGTLKFNHRLHLSPGLVEPGGRRPAWALADIDPELAEYELIFPSEEVLANTFQFKQLDEDEERRYQDAFQAVIGA